MLFQISKTYKTKSQPKQFEDYEILELYYQTKNISYIGDLFERYSLLVFGVCLKYLKNEAESKDAVMQIFEDLIKKLQIHKVENFKSWLYTLSKNYCLMQLREKQKKQKVFNFHENIDGGKFVENSYILHPNYAEETEEKLLLLNNALKQLNEEQNTCVKLLYLENKSYKEVSDITGYSLKQVKSFVQNGKRNLKIFMNQR